MGEVRVVKNNESKFKPYTLCIEIDIEDNVTQLNLLDDIRNLIDNWEVNTSELISILNKMRDELKR